MKLLCEKIVHTNEYAGTVDLITGINDFDVEITFDEEWHTYKHQGKILPSVTQLLDDGSYQNVDKDILRYAQEKGTLVHKEIQQWLEGQKEGITEEFDEFVRLFNENKEKFNEKAIFDHKTYAVATPKNRRKCYEQIKKYAAAIYYLTNETIDSYYLVHLPHGKVGRIYDLRKEFE